jgi:hypothetical protein
LKSGFAAPRAFISYAWEDRQHKQWIKEIAVKLRLDGVELLLDQWELAPGDELAEFMERAVKNSDAVLIVCTPTYKTKSDKRTGGVGYEGSIISAELVTGTARRKFIPILRKGEWSDAAPSWLLGSVYLDFRGEGTAVEDVYGELLETLHGRRETPPPVGSPPLPKHHSEGRDISSEDQSLDASLGSSQYPFVLTKMLDNAPDDAMAHEIGRQWLVKTASANPSWPFVWQALMKAAPDDPMLHEIGRQRLVKTASDNSSWAHVWNTLMNAAPDDPMLREIGRKWLLERRSE